MDIVDRITHAIGCHQCGKPIGDSVSDDFCGQDCQEIWHADRAQQLTNYAEPVDLPGHYSNLREFVSAETTPRHHHVRVPGGLPSDAAWLAEQLRSARAAIAAQSVEFSVDSSSLLQQDLVVVTVRTSFDRVRVVVPGEAADVIADMPRRVCESLQTGASLRHAVDVALGRWGQRDQRWPTPPDAWQQIGTIEPPDEPDSPVFAGLDPAGGEVVFVRDGLRRRMVLPPTVVVDLRELRQVQLRADASRQLLHEHMQAAMTGVAAAMERAGQSFRKFLNNVNVGTPPEPSRADRMQHALEARRNRNTGPTQQSRAPRRIDPGRESGDRAGTGRRAPRPATWPEQHGHHPGTR